jgi:hypothetical protein
MTEEGRGKTVAEPYYSRNKSLKLQLNLLAYVLTVSEYFELYY